jgi:glycosyltransferase involved in cell wall biosynthesis
VPPGDKTALARRSRQLPDNAELRQRMGKAGQRRMAPDFTASAMIERLTQSYIR